MATARWRRSALTRRRPTDLFARARAGAGSRRGQRRRGGDRGGAGCGDRAGSARIAGLARLAVHPARSRLCVPQPRHGADPRAAAGGAGGLASPAPAALLVSTVTGAAVAAGELDAGYWWRNVRLPVLFRRGGGGADRARRAAVPGNRAGTGAAVVPARGVATGRPARPGAGLADPPAPRVDMASLDPFAAIAAACHVAGAGIQDAPALDGFASARGLPAYPWQRQYFRAAPTVEAIEVATPGPRPSAARLSRPAGRATPGCRICPPRPSPGWPIMWSTACRCCRPRP